MAPSNGIINMMKRGIRKSQKSPKSPKSNKKKNLNYQSQREDPTDNECSQLLSKSIQSQRSPTSVNELDKALYSTFISEPSEMMTDPFFFDYPTSENRNISSKTRPSSLPAPLHPLSMSTPTLSDETLITSNCKRNKQFHDVFHFRTSNSMTSSSSSSSSSVSQTWLNSTPWDNDDQDEINKNDPSLCFPTHLSNLQIRPSLKHYLSLVLSSSDNERYKDEERAPSPDPPDDLSHVKRPTKSKKTIVEQLILKSCFSWDHEHNEVDKYSTTEFNPNTMIQETNNEIDEQITKNKVVQDTRSVQLSHQMKNLYTIANKHIENGDIDAVTNIFWNMTHNHIQDYGKNHLIVGVSYFNLGVAHIWKGDFSHAKKYLKYALTHRRKILSKMEETGNGEANIYYSCAILDVVESLSELGIAQFGLLDFDASLASFREALQLSCKIYGCDHPHAVKLLNCIGCVHYEQGQFLYAQSNFEKALDIERTQIGENPSCNAVGNKLLNLSALLGNVAMCFGKTKKLDDAVAILDEVLIVQESVLDEEHEIVWSTTSTLDLFGKLRDVNQKHNINDNVSKTIQENRNDLPVQRLTAPSQATLLFGEADGIPTRRQKLNASFDYVNIICLGSIQNESTSTQRIQNMIVTSLNCSSSSQSLSNPFLDMRDDNALNYTELDKYEIRNKSRIPLDMDNQKVVDAELHLQSIHIRTFQYLKDGNTNDALELLECVLNSHKEKYGEDHHLVGQVIHNTGTVYLFAQKYDSAVLMFEKAMKIRMNVLSSNHPDVSVSLLKTGIAHFATSHYDRALSIFCEALRVTRKNLGYNHHMVAQILNNIGTVHYECGGLFSALKALEEALEIQRCEYKKDTNNIFAIKGVAKILGNIGFVYVKRREYGEAIVALEEALGLYKQLPSNEENDLNVTKENLAFALAYANTSSQGDEVEKMIEIYKDML